MKWRLAVTTYESVENIQIAAGDPLCSTNQGAEDHKPAEMNREAKAMLVLQYRQSLRAKPFCVPSQAARAILSRFRGSPHFKSWGRGRTCLSATPSPKALASAGFDEAGSFGPQVKTARGGEDGNPISGDMVLVADLLRAAQLLLRLNTLSSGSDHGESG